MDNTTMLSVGDIIRREGLKGYTVWKIVGIHLGIVGQENLISIESLSHKPGTAYGKLHETMIVPENLIVHNSHLELIKRPA